MSCSLFTIAGCSLNNTSGRGGHLIGRFVAHEEDWMESVNYSELELAETNSIKVLVREGYQAATEKTPPAPDTCRSFHQETKKVDEGNMDEVGSDLEKIPFSESYPSTCPSGHFVRYNEYLSAVELIELE